MLLFFGFLLFFLEANIMMDMYCLYFTHSTFSFFERDRFPYYKSNDDRWKNSVRHNLSINPHFRKGNKAKAGAGHLWKISSRESEANFLAWEHVSCHSFRFTTAQSIIVSFRYCFLFVLKKRRSNVLNCFSKWKRPTIWSIRIWHSSVRRSLRRTLTSMLNRWTRPLTMRNLMPQRPQLLVCRLKLHRR